MIYGTLYSHSTVNYGLIRFKKDRIVFGKLGMSSFTLDRIL